VYNKAYKYSKIHEDLMHKKNNNLAGTEFIEKLRDNTLRINFYGKILASTNNLIFLYL